MVQSSEILQHSTLDLTVSDTGGVPYNCDCGTVCHSGTNVPGPARYSRGAGEVTLW